MADDLGNLPHLAAKGHSEFSDSSNNGGILSLTPFYHVPIFNTSSSHPMRRISILFLVSLWQRKRKNKRTNQHIFFLHNWFELSATKGSLSVVQQIIHPKAKRSCQLFPAYLDETSEIERTTKLHALPHSVFFKGGIHMGQNLDITIRGEHPLTNG